MTLRLLVSSSLCLFVSLTFCLLVSSTLCLFVSLSLCLFDFLTLSLFVSLTLSLFVSLTLSLFVFFPFLQQGLHRGGAALVSMVWSFPVGGCLRFFGEAASGSHVLPDGIIRFATCGEFVKAGTSTSATHLVIISSSSNGGGCRQEGTFCEEADGLRGRSHVGFAAWYRYLLIFFHDVLIV